MYNVHKNMVAARNMFLAFMFDRYNRWSIWATDIKVCMEVRHRYFFKLGI